jgi:hypothetical protein
MGRSSIWAEQVPIAGRLSERKRTNPDEEIEMATKKTKRYVIVRTTSAGVFAGGGRVLEDVSRQDGSTGNRSRAGLRRDHRPVGSQCWRRG